MLTLHRVSNNYYLHKYIIEVSSWWKGIDFILRVGEHLLIKLYVHKYTTILSLVVN